MGTFRRPNDSGADEALGCAEVVAALPPDGGSTTFAYAHARWTPPARRLLRSLRQRFDEVVISRTVRANLPPALVNVCRRPLSPVRITMIAATHPGMARAGHSVEHLRRRSATAALLQTRVPLDARLRPAGDLLTVASVVRTGPVRAVHSSPI